MMVHISRVLLCLCQGEANYCVPAEEWKHQLFARPLRVVRQNDP